MQNKQNIEAPVLSGPTIVGKIDLEGIQPAKKSFSVHGSSTDSKIDTEGIQPAKKSFSVYGNFPIEHYEKINQLIKKVNKDLGKDAVTMSKVAKIDGKVSEKHGSIWFSCEKQKFYSEFQKPFELMMVELTSNCHRINKADMLNMPYGQSFCVAYMFKHNAVKVSPCVKIFTTAKQAKVGIYYTKVKDHTQTPNVMPFESINEDGTFKADNATGYLFVSNETFKADL